MPKRKSPYSILIVCEGTNTEPNYFKGLREDVLARHVWTAGVSIVIRPKPPLDETSEIVHSKHKTKRKKRQLKQTKISIPICDIEEEYKAIPTRYVREAQMGLESGLFDEVWAVFDKDYHARHPEAFALANKKVNGKIVNIAFSSIAFEHWVALHFEKNEAVFTSSACKEKKPRSEHPKALCCGTGIHVDDCGGESCAEGYLVQHHLPNYSKKAQIDLYTLLKGKTEKAIENASWLRNQNPCADLPVFERNPYTNVDVLVKRLLQIEMDCIWLNLGEKKEIGGCIIQIECLSKNELLLSVTNTQTINQVFHIEYSGYRNDKITSNDSFRLGLIAPKQVCTQKINFKEKSYDKVKFVLNGKHTLFLGLSKV